MCLLTRKKETNKQASKENEDLNATMNSRKPGMRSSKISIDLGNLGKQTSLQAPVEVIEQFAPLEHDARMDVGILDAKLENFMKTQDDLRDYLDQRKLKAKFADFQTKMRQWEKRSNIRRRFKEKFKKQSAHILANLVKARDTQFSERDQTVEEVYNNYVEFKENLTQAMKKEKVLNDFLFNIPDSAQIINIEDLQRLILKEESTHNERVKLLTDFVADVKSDCLTGANLFGFVQIPEVIIKRSYSRK